MVNKAWVADENDYDAWGEGRLFILFDQTRNGARQQLTGEIGCDYLDAAVRREPALDGVYHLCDQMAIYGGWVECSGCYKDIHYDRPQRYSGGYKPDDDPKDGSPYAYASEDDVDAGYAELTTPHKIGGEVFCSARCAAKHYPELWEQWERNRKRREEARR